MAGAATARETTTRLPHGGARRRADRAASAHLVFGRGAARVSLRAERGQAEPYLAQFEGIEPHVTADGARVTISYAPIRPREYLRARRRAAHVTLSPAQPWELRFEDGIERLRADLRGLELASLTVGGGAVDAELLLPEPRGVVPIRITGGVSGVTLLRFPGAAVLVRVRGGAVKLALDGRRLRAVGEETWYGGVGPDDARARYELDITGGASELTLAELGARRGGR